MSRNDFNYCRPPLVDIKKLLDEFQTEISDFLFYFRGYPKNLEVSVCELDVIDMIIRVDKRQAYFHIFHNNMEINECKRAGLYAYWFAKFRPIKITDKRYQNKPDHVDVNEYFALHYLLAMLREAGRIDCEISEDSQFIKELRYSLRWRNFTIDSLIVLADSINSDTIKIIV
jgi:hypothetical protein